MDAIISTTQKWNSDLRAKRATVAPPCSHRDPVIQPYGFRRVLWFLALGMLAIGLALASRAAQSPPMDDSNPLRMPVIGDHQLRLITPTLLELTMVTTATTNEPVPVQWNFVDTNGNLTTPPLSDFVVTVNSNTQPVTVQSVGYKSRVLYAPLKQWDLRIGNYLYLKLAAPIADGSFIQVVNPAGDLWSTNVLYTFSAAAQRCSPAIHVNQVGYIPSMPKIAMVGYYIGSMGELTTSNLTSFLVVDANTGATNFQGTLSKRPDVGYTYTPTPYQQVMAADFSSFTNSGQYKLMVPGLGASFPFFIDNSVAGAFARTYELGIYGQRCGTNNEIPYTRFTHSSCHTNPATVPSSLPTNSAPVVFVNGVLETESLVGTNNVNETAPRMTNIWASLYPYVNTNAVDTRGGHHDAGDYSKYTTSVANFIHYMMFAVDAFPGVNKLDNLGIPESGDGISDILQEAKWEADYLAKLQDTDGGFYFIVYPATREYESNVLPDQGDPQIVLPKNTACTAAAVAALAEIGSSPTFKAAYPATASNYLAKAVAGWGFLTNAFAKYGRNGSYQTITFSGDWMMHNDELAWAAAALYAATGNTNYDNDLRVNTPNPNDPSLRRWGWWSMYACYGNAFRTYAFAARTGRLQPNQLNAAYLAQCEAEIKFAASNAVAWSGEMAYGSSFSDANKGPRTAGWYFSGEQTFDPAVAYLIQTNTATQQSYLDVIVKNFNYEMGCNPVNVTYLTGLGSKRQREIVDQYAQNDYRVLPPSGIPLGNIQQGYYWTPTYGSELSTLTYPADSLNNGPYPMYDRWADSYNVDTEFIVSQQSARSLVASAFLMTKSSVSNQVWNSASAQITGLPAQFPANQPVTVGVSVSGLDLSQARIVWEARDQEPFLGANFTFTPVNAGVQWVEVEAQLPDGRRVVALTNYTAVQVVTNTVSLYQTMPLSGNTNVIAWYTFDNTFSDATGREPNLQTAGNATIDTSSFSWSNNPAGGALRVFGIGDQVTANVPNTNICVSGQTTNISIEATIYVNAYKGYSVANATIFSLVKNWNAELALQQNMWAQTPAVVTGAGNITVDNVTLGNYLIPGQWQYLKIMLDSTGYSVFVNNTLILRTNSTDLQTWGGSGASVIEAGNFDGWIDDIVIKSFGASVPTAPGGGTTTNAPPPSTLGQGTNYVTSGAAADSRTVAIYHMDGTLADATGKSPPLATSGNARLDTSNVSWLASPPSGAAALRVFDIGDAASVTLTNVQFFQSGQTQAVSIEAMVYVNQYEAYGRNSEPIVELSKQWNAQLIFNQDKWGTSPEYIGGNDTVSSAANLAPYLMTNCWQKVGLFLDATGYTIKINDQPVASATSADLANWAGVGSVTVSFGNFNGWVDEVVVHAAGTNIFSSTTSTNSGNQTTNSQVSTNAYLAAPVSPDSSTVALYHFDGSLANAAATGGTLTLTGNAQLNTSNLTWMAAPAGSAIRFFDLGDYASVKLTNFPAYQAGKTKVIAVESMVFVNNYKAYSRQSATLLEISRQWNAQMIWDQDKWGTSPQLLGGSATIFSAATLLPFLKTNCWQKLGLYLDLTGYSVRVNDQVVATFASGDLTNWSGTGSVTLQFGSFDGWMDEVTVRGSTNTLPAPVPVVNLAATVPVTSEAGTNTGLVTFTRAGGNLAPPLTVNFTAGGSAQSGINYAAVGNSVTIPGGQTSTAVAIQPFHDGVFTGPLAVALSVATNAAYQLGTNSSATVTILDLDQPGLAIQTASGGSSATQIKLSAPTPSGVTYLVQSSTDLANWTFINTNQLGQTLNFADSIPAIPTNRYYRTVFVFGAPTAANVAQALTNYDFASNVVGFVNISAGPGFSLIANPLNAATNNLASLLGPLPSQTQFYKYVTSNSGYTIATYTNGAWDLGGLSLDPGEGGFLSNPTSTNLLVTFIGQVLQGTLANPLPSGYSIRGSMTPVANPLATYPAQDGDQIDRFINGTWYVYTYSDGLWTSSGSPPFGVNVGEGLFLFKNSAAVWNETLFVTDPE